jgi:hypothetical protein
MGQKWRKTREEDKGTNGRLRERRRESVMKPMGKKCWRTMRR